MEGLGTRLGQYQAKLSIIGLLDVPAPSLTFSEEGMITAWNLVYTHVALRRASAGVWAQGFTIDNTLLSMVIRSLLRA